MLCLRKWFFRKLPAPIYGKEPGQAGLPVIRSRCPEAEFSPLTHVRGIRSGHRPGSSRRKSIRENLDIGRPSASGQLILSISAWSFRRHPHVSARPVIHGTAGFPPCPRSIIRTLVIKQYHKERNGALLTETTINNTRRLRRIPGGVPSY